MAELGPFGRSCSKPVHVACASASASQHVPVQPVPRADPNRRLSMTSLLYSHLEPWVLVLSVEAHHRLAAAARSRRTHRLRAILRLDERSSAPARLIQVKRQADESMRCSVGARGDGRARLVERAGQRAVSGWRGTRQADVGAHRICGCSVESDMVIASGRVGE